MGAPASGHYRFALRLQSALSVDEVERTYLDSVDDVVFASGYGLYRLDPETGSALAVAADVDPTFLDEYEEFGRSDDPVLNFVAERTRPIDSTRVGGRSAWESSGAYQCLERAGYYHSMEAPVLVAGVPCATLNFARRTLDRPFDAADLRAAQSLSEQVGLALERAVRYEETGQRVTLLEDALDHLPHAVVVTDLEANVIFGNRAARDGAHPRSDGAREAIDEAMEDIRGRNKRVTVASTTDADGERLFVKSIRLGEVSDACVSVIYPGGGDAAGRLPAWDVLSAREQEIAELVSQGLTTKEIAARAFITENTVKQHLKRIFAKTDVHNRAELMQRIWTARNPPG
jgi:DNA-binding CsgD family transcriptional regulator/GAF domain-containing protein